MIEYGSFLYHWWYTIFTSVSNLLQFFQLGPTKKVLDLPLRRGWESGENADIADSVRGMGVLGSNTDMLTFFNTFP